VDRASRFNSVKKNQLDIQLILSIVRQPLHVSRASIPIIRRYNRIFTFGTYYSFLDDCPLSWTDWNSNSNPSRTTDSHL